MIGLLKQVKTATFVGGVVVGAVAKPILQSKTVRDVTVTVLAKGYGLKQQVEEQWVNLREEAEDIYAEATMKAETDAKEKAERKAEEQACCQATGKREVSPEQAEAFSGKREVSEVSEEGTTGKWEGSEPVTSTTVEFGKEEDIALDDISEDWKNF